MSTTEHRSATSYSEHDKLGPLGARTSPLGDPAQLRGALVRSFEAAAQAAREAVAEVDQGSAAAAVHDSRKALRRARAVLGLVGGALPKGERRAIRDALQEARRALSSVRDHAVAPDTLAGLELGERDRATAKTVLTNATEAMPASAEIKQLLGEAAARAAAQAEALRAALPAELEWDTVAAGLADTYREAREAIKAAKKSKAGFHTWRRRAKELVYQLDLVAEHAGPRVAAIKAEIAGVSDALSEAVDLIMLHDFVATYPQGIAQDAIDKLRETIHGQLDEHMKAARKTARESFSQKTKKFEKRVTKSVHRDLAPADDEPPHTEAF
ncbi:MAG TPA: CHAD domain-containing protein [Kofleriaceae bacterium]